MSNDPKHGDVSPDDVAASLGDFARDALISVLAP